MWAILGLGGFVGFFVCLILLIISAFKGEPKKPMVLGLSVCVVLFAVGASLTPSSNAKKDDGPDETSAPPSQVVDIVSEEPVESSNQTETPLPPAESDTPPESSEYVLDLDTVMTICRISLSQNFGEDNYTLEYDDTSATINLWADNVALGATLAASGDKNAKASWATMVDGQKSLCNSIVEQIEATGAENYYVMINVLNDMDKSKTLLSILNGIVVFDAVDG